MFYLSFAAFFTAYVLLGWFTDVIELSTVGVIICIAFIFGNIYMYLKAKKGEKKESS